MKAVKLRAPWGALFAKLSGDEGSGAFVASHFPQNRPQVSPASRSSGPPQEVRDLDFQCSYKELACFDGLCVDESRDLAGFKERLCDESQSWIDAR